MTKDSMLTKELYDALTDLLINVEEDVPRECMSKHLIVAIEDRKSTRLNSSHT